MIYFGHVGFRVDFSLSKNGMGCGLQHLNGRIDCGSQRFLDQSQLQDLTSHDQF